ncbi:MAG: hypothetical protein ACI9EF_000317 [Pseudohongiellaceae bacterium]
MAVLGHEVAASTAAKSAAPMGPELTDSAIVGAGLLLVVFPLALAYRLLGARRRAT